MTSQSGQIEKDGVLLGAAVVHGLGYQFIALDARVADMDQSIWPSVEYGRNSVLQFFRAGCASVGKPRVSRYRRVTA